jgi:hypothetical protein
MKWAWGVAGEGALGVTEALGSERSEKAPAGAREASPLDGLSSSTQPPATRRLPRVINQLSTPPPSAPLDGEGEVPLLMESLALASSVATGQGPGAAAAVAAVAAVAAEGSVLHLKLVRAAHLPVMDWQIMGGRADPYAVRGENLALRVERRGLGVER